MRRNRALQVRRFDSNREIGDRIRFVFEQWPAIELVIGKHNPRDAAGVEVDKKDVAGQGTCPGTVGHYQVNLVAKWQSGGRGKTITVRSLMISRSCSERLYVYALQGDVFELHFDLLIRQALREVVHQPEIPLRLLPVNPREIRRLLPSGRQVRHARIQRDETARVGRAIGEPQEVANGLGEVVPQLGDKHISAGGRAESPFRFQTE